MTAKTLYEIHTQHTVRNVSHWNHLIWQLWIVRIIIVNGKTVSNSLRNFRKYRIVLPTINSRRKIKCISRQRNIMCKNTIVMAQKKHKKYIKWGKKSIKSKWLRRYCRRLRQIAINISHFGNVVWVFFSFTSCVLCLLISICHKVISSLFVRFYNLRLWWWHVLCHFFYFFVYLLIEWKFAESTLQQTEMLCIKF